MSVARAEGVSLRTLDWLVGPLRPPLCFGHFPIRALHPTETWDPSRAVLADFVGSDDGPRVSTGWWVLGCIPVLSPCWAAK